MYTGPPNLSNKHPNDIKMLYFDQISVLKASKALLLPFIQRYK